jgi:hypothetical protein
LSLDDEAPSDAALPVDHKVDESRYGSERRVAQFPMSRRATAMAFTA